MNVDIGALTGSLQNIFGQQGFNINVVPNGNPFVCV
jgi:hypothetical protein